MNYTQLHNWSWVSFLLVWIESHGNKLRKNQIENKKKIKPQAHLWIRHGLWHDL